MGRLKVIAKIESYVIGYSLSSRRNNTKSAGCDVDVDDREGR